MSCLKIEQIFKTRGVCMYFTVAYNEIAIYILIYYHPVSSTCCIHLTHCGMNTIIM